MAEKQGFDFAIIPSNTTSYVLRVQPGQEIVGALTWFAKRARMRAGFVQTCVGSVSEAVIRMASATADTDQANHIKRVEGCHEIVSLVGTLAVDEDLSYKQHLHVCLSDKDGNTIGGHVISLKVFTTAEIVLGECKQLVFSRPHDPQTGYGELHVGARDPDGLDSTAHAPPSPKKPKEA
ncbi:hypothetical protein PTSG_11324 [Salpingoeca rosetta]|uniref:PPC domain-containing protein n=1 Tax=Salpingoeca rosetta (strain ATCC 50818 / BSB-021) TaxID=946362 RepID=F2UT28_SALR5|nr:uncharacterized protein PTSG_11324 [Salpingoeca rosetta]EGD81287.1 hypothetical protein PTSG_11324 [Salpingoeca rosetta]|eukprot:XP_004987683.1 hypothetical protein PTSG_11324 [Salpingoeca rosetta]